MKKVIVALCLLLSLAFIGTTYAGGGQEEPTYPPYCWNQVTGGKLWYPCGSEELRVAHCANLMETAMVKIDPYLQFAESDTLTMTPREQKEYKSALYVWNRIKHECWKEYEEERLLPQHIH